MSTVALAIGLLVGNIISPGTGLNIAGRPEAGAKLAEQAHGSGGTMEFFEDIIPTSLLSSLTEGNVLQALFVALLVGFAIQAMGPAGEPVLRGVGLSRSWSSASWSASCGWHRSAHLVPWRRWSATPDSTRLMQLGVLMLAFYLTCIIFVFGVLGTLLRVAARVRSSSWCATWPASTC